MGEPTPCDQTRASAADDAAGQAADALLESGWKLESIALLTTGHRHSIKVERIDFHDQDGYWKTLVPCCAQRRGERYQPAALRVAQGVPPRRGVDRLTCRGRRPAQGEAAHTGEGAP